MDDNVLINCNVVNQHIGDWINEYDNSQPFFILVNPKSFSDLKQDPEIVKHLSFKDSDSDHHAWHYTYDGYPLVIDRHTDHLQILSLDAVKKAFKEIGEEMRNARITEY